MGLEKAIRYGKEHRKEYRGAKSISLRCRNHGGCEWCEQNRKYSFNKEQERVNDALKEYYGGQHHE